MMRIQLALLFQSFLLFLEDSQCISLRHQFIELLCRSVDRLRSVFQVLDLDNNTQGIPNIFHRNQEFHFQTHNLLKHIFSYLLHSEIFSFRILCICHQYQEILKMYSNLSCSDRLDLSINTQCKFIEGKSFLLQHDLLERNVIP